MSNYYAATRSNYFRVKDAAAFGAWADSISGLEYEVNDGVAYMHANEGDACGWPSQVFDEEGNFEREVDLAQELAQHVAEDDVAILLEVGSEKLRYLHGDAIAVSGKPGAEPIHLYLNQIYGLAFDAFGITPTQAEY